MTVPHSNLARAADDLQQRETDRLAAALVPTVEGLRLLGGRQLRARVALTLALLGYELLTPDSAGDVVAIKDGKKYLVAFAPDTELAPIHTNHLTRLHRAVIDASAAAGFFVTPRGFTRDAEAYAATAPLRLVDGPKLVASITRSMQGIPAPESYKAMCRQCGGIVTHRLGGGEAVPCANGHPVAPTIARAAFTRQEGGSTSRTYTPPRPYTRREVNAHNSKYITRMKKRQRAPPSEPVAAPDNAPEPLASE
jgi:Restriction endonuclease